MSTESFIGNIAWAILNQLFSRGSLTLAAIILARSFDTSQFAAFGYFQLTVAMFATFAVMGLGTGGAKVAADLVHRNDATDDGSLGRLWSISVVLAVIAAVIVLFLPEDWIGGSLNLPRWLFAAGVFAVALQAFPNGAILGLEEFRRSAYNSLVSAMLVIGASLAAVELANVHIAIYGVIFASFAQVVGNSYLVISRLRIRASQLILPTTLEQARFIFEIVAPLATGAAIVTTGMWLVGRIILEGQGGAYGFALYSIGMQWFALAMFVPANVGSVLLPRLVKLRAGKESSTGFLRQAVLAAISVSGMVAVVGTLFSPLLVRMYGDRYSHHIWLIPAYLAAAVLTSPMTALGNGMLAHDLHWKRLLLFVAWLLIALGSAWNLRNVMIYGGAISIAAAYGCLSLAMWVQMRRRALV